MSDVLPPWTVETLAESIGAHPETIRRHRREGRLRGFLVTGRWRFYDEDVEAYLRSAPSTKPAPSITPVAMIIGQRPVGIPARARRR